MTAHLSQLATVADRAAFLLVRDDAQADLQLLAGQLERLAANGTHLDAADADRLARCAQTGLAGVPIWLAGTRALCLLAAAGESQTRRELTGELPERLAALSWAWGQLPETQLAALQAADEDAVQQALLLDREIASKELPRERVEGRSANSL